MDWTEAFGWLAGPRAKHMARRDQRYRTEGFSCPLGEVLDLSSSGMRIRCTDRPPLAKGRSGAFTVSTGGQRLAVNGRVAWVRRTSREPLFYEFGVMFEDTRPAVRRALESLARFGFLPGGGKASAAHAGENGKAVRADMQVQDLYAILGVRPDATAEQVRAAYRTLARDLHPDTKGGGTDNERFTLVSKAYAVLRDAKARRRYDELLARASAAA